MGALDKIIPARFRKARAGLPAPPAGKLQLIGPVSTRASKVGRLIALLTGGKNVPQRSTVKYEINARDGYESNPIVYRCIRLVAEALKSMPLLAYTTDQEGKQTELPANHPLRVVLDSPNPRQSIGEFLDELVGHLYLAGEAFPEGVALPRGELAEIYLLRPDRMTVVPGDDGLALAYEFEAATGRQRFDVPERGFSPVMHIRQWNPRDYWRGLPIVAPAAAPADEYADTVKQNRALLNNSAQPSGALVYTPKEGQGNLTDEQWERTNTELMEEHVGPENAGKPFVLDNFDWKPMGMSPRDAMAVEQRAAAARETALALGVPPLLLGLPGDNTYANYAEAKSAFWEQTVWPLAHFLGDKFTRWLRPINGPSVKICFDRESSPMAEAERAARWERIDKSSVLSIDEKREELGWEALEGGKGKHILVPSGMSILDDVILGEPDPEAAGESAYGNQVDEEE